MNAVEIKMMFNNFFGKKNFALGRFDFSKLIVDIRGMSVLPAVLTDEDTGMEINIDEGVQKEWLMNVLQHFNELDNQIQQKNQSEWERFQQLAKENKLPQDAVHEPLRDVRYFQQHPYWIEVSAKDVTVDYVGDTYNTEWVVVFQFLDGEWHFHQLV